MFYTPEDAAVIWLESFIDNDVYFIAPFTSRDLPEDKIGIAVRARNARHSSSISPEGNERIYEVDIWFSLAGPGRYQGTMARTAWKIVNNFRSPLSPQLQAGDIDDDDDENEVRILSIRLFSGPRPLGEDGIRLGKRAGIDVEGVAIVAMKDS